MGFHDLLVPHRYLLRRSLRRSSAETMRVVEAHRAARDLRVEEIETELKTEEAQRKEEREKLESTLREELRAEDESLSKLHDDIASYASVFHERERLRAIAKAYDDRASALYEYVGFLKEQLSLIDRETKQLETLKVALESSARVDDIVGLGLVSGNGLSFSPGDSAGDLLDKIRLSDAYNRDRWSPESKARSALWQMVQERADCARAAQYVGWLIRQKGAIRSELKSDMADTIEERRLLRSEADAARTRADEMNADVCKASREVRIYWLRPMATYEADYSYVLSALKRNKKDHKAACQEHKRASKDTYRDSYKLDRLSDKITALGIAIDDLTRDKQIIKEVLDHWRDEKEMVLELLNQHGVYLVGAKTDDELSDQLAIIQARLAEIQADSLRKAQEAEEACDRERASIEHERDEEVAAIDDQIVEAETRLGELEAETPELEERLRNSAEELGRARSHDTRVLFRWPDTPEVKSAKSAVRSARNALAMNKVLKQQAQKERAGLQGKREQLLQEYGEKLRRCRPRAAAKSEGEIREEEGLMLREAYLSSKKRVTPDEVRH